MKRRFAAIIIAMVLMGCAAAGPSRPMLTENPPPLPAAAAPILFFQRFLSRADGHRCPMTPSCSSYAMESIRRHGAVMGWIMACDRLMRCGRDELKHRPMVMTRNGWRCSDPVTNNDFWMH
ncbi:hypothetical protein DSCO28_07120 [Desulfosarcina ovata subsp. sediminis]|uniref:Membrane protein insertion efficiency factor YidD n=1 Tax=Desulfosarcina ovata subsp. sediminis TaxID=885957 RepID=A0A5K7ZGP3_9BACT|nr:membrane protein insertion efficiency factor YidD [Desulfosarcina ovata]BBO80146.1 hypothetical protein DSCO28_07120 [Desulfosarcina ovata subsp. sediminis]